MLVLSRKAGESLRIYGPSTVTVSRIAGKRAVIGIDGPARVMRGELFDDEAEPELEEIHVRELVAERVAEVADAQLVAQICDALDLPLDAEPAAILSAVVHAAGALKQRPASDPRCERLDRSVDAVLGAAAANYRDRAAS